MSLFTDLNVDVWLTPESGTPGLNAVTAAEDFNLTGTADGYETGDGGQSVLQMSGSDLLTADATFLTGLGADHYLNGLHNASQFWVLVYWNPQGDTGTWQVAFETASGANAGYRMRVYGDGTNGAFYINDGAGSNLSMGPITVAKGSRWDQNGGNMLLMQVDITNGFYEGWNNGRTKRLESNYRKDISGLTWGAAGSATPNTVAPRCGLNGDVMFACGSGILTDAQVEMLMEYGKGISWAKLNATTKADRQISWRAQPDNDSLSIVGCYSEAPNLRLYTDGSRTTRGTLVSSSGALTLDSQGWASYTFTGLTADATYQVFAEYTDGEQDRRRMRVKTLPSSTDGMNIVFAGCWKYDPDLAFSSSISLEAQFLTSTLITLIDDVDPDVLAHVGDDGYYDNMWDINLAGTLPIELVADYQTVHEYIFDRNKLDELFAEIPFFSGCFSDHDFLKNDTFGADATSANIAAAQAHWKQRTGKTFPLDPDNSYHTWQTPGITWIALDMRTEAETAVQLTSTTQRALMQTDATAAVSRGDLIVLMTEYPWDDNESPAPAASWDNFTAEREDIFDRLATAGVTDRIICAYGDQHAGGVDIDGTSQGGWDGGGGAGTGVVLPVCILASRFNHGSAGSAVGAATHPDYYDNGVGHFINVLLEDNAGRIDVTVTPYEQAVAKTPILRTLSAAPASTSLYLALDRRKLRKGGPKKAVYPKPTRGLFR